MISCSRFIIQLTCGILRAAGVTSKHTNLNPDPEVCLSEFLPGEAVMRMVRRVSASEGIRVKGLAIGLGTTFRVMVTDMLYINYGCGCGQGPCCGYGCHEAILLTGHALVALKGDNVSLS